MHTACDVMVTTCEPRHEISNNVVCATSKASDQPAHTHCPIRAVASRLNYLLMPIVSKIKLTWQYICDDSTLINFLNNWICYPLLFRHFGIGVLQMLIGYPTFLINIYLVFGFSIGFFFVNVKNLLTNQYIWTYCCYEHNLTLFSQVILNECENQSVGCVHLATLS